jgi:hypothetical protein
MVSLLSPDNISGVDKEDDVNDDEVAAEFGSCGVDDEDQASRVAVRVRTVPFALTTGV